MTTVQFIVQGRSKGMCRLWWKLRIVAATPEWTVAEAREGFQSDEGGRIGRTHYPCIGGKEDGALRMAGAPFSTALI